MCYLLKSLTVILYSYVASEVVGAPVQDYSSSQTLEMLATCLVILSRLCIEILHPVVNWYQTIYLDDTNQCFGD